MKESTSERTNYLGSKITMNEFSKRNKKSKGLTDEIFNY